MDSSTRWTLSSSSGSITGLQWNEGASSRFLIESSGLWKQDLWQWGYRQKKKNSGRPFRAVWSVPRYQMPPFMHSPAPTHPPVLSSLVVFLSLPCRRAGRRGQIQSDLAMVCLRGSTLVPAMAPFSSWPRGSVREWDPASRPWISFLSIKIPVVDRQCLVLDRQCRQKKKCWSTLDFYNNAEHIQLASFSSTLLRLTYENKAYVGQSTALHWPFPSNSIRSGTMASYIPHLWPFICPVFADGNRSLVSVLASHRSLLLSFLKHFGAWRTA